MHGDGCINAAIKRSLMMRVSDEVDKKFKETWDNDHTKEIKDTKHDEILIWLYKKLKEDDALCLNLCGIKEYISICNKKLFIEFPISKIDYRGTGNKLIGFCDLALFLEYKIKLTDEQIAHNLKIKDSRYDFGYSDKETATAYIEIKSKVNIGETIRQINYYRSFDNKIWAVCAPNFSSVDLLLDSGIKFINYDTKV